MTSGDRRPIVGHIAAETGSFTPATETEDHAVAACRRVLADVDRDPHSPTRGCFDRRYWAWKMADMPDATLQRNVFALAWWRDRVGDGGEVSRPLLMDAVIAALRYAASIQHDDGSFDQAFPGEHSYGATAFLLFDLGRAAEAVVDDCPAEDRTIVDRLLRNAAAFLCANRERHGVISNHLAGAAAALTLAAERLGEPRFRARAHGIVDELLRAQSDEGWFPEYGGADPGYQSLCLFYLAWIQQRHRDPRLFEALGRAVEFLSWFAHPGGGFGGEYGSRRTALLHPGGFALLRHEIPLAGAMATFAERAMLAGQSPSPADLDAGNVAPLFMSYAAMLAHPADPERASVSLPFERSLASRDFAAAGLAVRSTAAYFAVFGASNGGVLKVLRKPDGLVLRDDGGYVAELEDGGLATSQVSGDQAVWELSGGTAMARGPFRALPRELPTPGRFVIIRVFTLLLGTLPAQLQAGLREWFKKQIVRRLMAVQRPVPLALERRISFTPERVEIDDAIRASAPVAVRRLECGAPFVAIHMASARYFPGFAGAWPPPGRQVLDPGPLASGSEIRNRVVVG